MRETEKVERLGFAEAPVCASLDRIAAELDHARFIWVQYQRKLYQPLAQIRQKSLGLIPVFKRYCSRQKLGDCELNCHRYSVLRTCRLRFAWMISARALW